MDFDLVLFVGVGFAAQLIDGAIGMGYGVIASSVLIATGMPPAVASAAVHVTKIPTGIASGLSHWKFGNIDWPVCRRLILPGIAGGIIGASVIALLPIHVIRPLAALYLGLMGIVVILRALRWRQDLAIDTAPKGRPGIVGFLGGLFDSFGGGWGPIVTSSLLLQGREPRRVVGSTNAAEPVVAAVQAAVFSFWLGAATLTTIGSTALAIMVGALLAAPIAAFLVNKLPGRLIAGAVGIILIGLNIPAVVSLIGRLL
ncbi:sulfite exporter TauE/SafE family protein [Ferrovibrio terrae]|uniref:sulfite exporter TauE/SafE family protein n=1 Tax=Ferrovibrio terrae TaxID=2594003 RepID=UPI0031377578